MKEKLQLNKKSVFLLGCFVGALIFISIYGAKVLNFTYDDWLMLEGDLLKWCKA